MIGHDVTACHWLHPEYVVEKIDRTKKHVVVLKRTTQKYVEKYNPYGIGSSKAFEVPHITNAVPVISHAKRVVPSAYHDVTIITPIELLLFKRIPNPELFEESFTSGCE